MWVLLHASYWKACHLYFVLLLEVSLLAFSLRVKEATVGRVPYAITPTVAFAYYGLRYANYASVSSPLALPYHLQNGLKTKWLHKPLLSILYGSVRFKRKKARRNALDALDLTNETTEMAIPLRREKLSNATHNQLANVYALVELADYHNCKGITALQTDSLEYITDFVLILEAEHPLQSQAVHHALVEFLNACTSTQLVGTDGTPQSGWVCIATPHILIHILSPLLRRYYTIEKLLANANNLDITDYLTPQTPPSYYNALKTEHPTLFDTNSTHEASDATNDTDPFWS